MNELKPWLPALEPPAGGYVRLTHAIAARRQRAVRHAWRGRIAWAGAAAALVLARTPLLRTPDAERQQAQAIAASLEQAWAQGDQEIRVADGAAAEILKAPGLRAYWVGTVSDPAAAR